MLIEFRVSNFRSIKDEQVLSLVASKDKTHLESHTIETGIKAVPRLLKSAVVYGPNASGKSNLVHAFDTMRDILKNSANLDSNYKYEHLQSFRLDKNVVKQPTTFDITLMIKGIRYQYGFEIAPDQIRSEWLYVYKTSRPQKWFERTIDDAGKQNFDINSIMGADRNIWVKSTKPYSLLLSTAVLLNSTVLKPLFDFIVNDINIFNVNELVFIDSFMEFLADENNKNGFLSFIRAVDVGISDVLLQERNTLEEINQLELGQAGKFKLSDFMQENMVELIFRHKNVDSAADFLFNDESGGTQKMIVLFPFLLKALKHGGIIVFDELDRSLHPHMVKQILNLFNSDKSNIGGQIVFTTHNTALLDTELLRRDQIWFIEKDRSQASRLFPLTDFSPRKNEAIESGYLTGRYGAIPFIGDFDIGK